MIVLSLPFYDSHSIVHKPQLAVDWVEYRLDYCTHLSDIDFKIFPQQSILTFRSKSEGGASELFSADKIALLQAIGSNTECLVDVEFAFLQQNPDLVIAPERMILSLHTDYRQTTIIRDFTQTIIPAAHYKLAISCENIRQFADIISLLPAEKLKHFTLLPLPPCASSVRLFYRLFPSEFTYVYDIQPLVNNQISLSLATLCRIKTLNKQTEVYGIIGGRQILHSLSVRVYNEWFSQNQHNKVFLPIVSETLADAMSQIQWLESHCQVKGFAVTMPFKQSLPQYLGSTDDPINTWIPQTGFTANTDKIALNIALDTLGLSPNSTVLIIGRGAMAKLAIKLCSERNYVIHQMQINYQSKPEQPPTKQQCTIQTLPRYDLLLNCTPWGMDSMDDPELVPEHYALIDLPYSTAPTTLVMQAQKKQIPYIDGIRFWLWQATEQSKIFTLGLSSLALSQLVSNIMPPR